MKRFIDCVFPSKTCNLRCHYCYITHTGSFGAKPPVFPYSAEQIGRALAPERLGGICHLNVCGEGETLLPRGVLDILYRILQAGHLIMVVTNGTMTERFETIWKWPREIRSRLGFKFSYHFLELKRLGLLNVFWTNVRKTRDAGCSISVELTPSDEMIPFIREAIDQCVGQAGAVCHVTVARNERYPGYPILTSLPRERYLETWGVFNSDLFAFKLAVFGQKRREYCYAGEWSAVLNLCTGTLKQCYKGRCLQNIFQDVARPIRFEAIGHHCPEPHCYNAHAYLTLGVIPELATPTYDTMRNRRCEDGSEWLNPEMKACMQSKFANVNKQDRRIKKVLMDLKGEPHAIRQWIGARARTIRLARLPGLAGHQGGAHAP
jgi:hypothetical protein